MKETIGHNLFDFVVITIACPSITGVHNLVSYSNCPPPPLKKSTILWWIIARIYLAKGSQRLQGRKGSEKIANSEGLTD